VNGYRLTASDSEKGNVGLLRAPGAARGGLRGSGAADHREDDGECIGGRGGGGGGGLQAKVV
jgi:hypothetical protein